MRPGLNQTIAFPVRVVAFVYIGLILSIIRVCLLLLPFKSVCKLTSSFADLSKRAPVLNLLGLDASDIAGLVNAAARRSPGAVTRLPRALTCQTLLAASGFDSVFQIGVVTDDKGGLKAHAWVEREGLIVIGGQPGLSEFRPLPSMETAGL